MFSQGRGRVLALLVADAVCIASAWLISVLVYWFFWGKYDPDLYLGFWPVVFVFLALNVAAGLYHGSLIYPGAPLSPVDELRKLILSAFITHLGVIVVLVMLFQTTRGYSRAAISIAGILTAVLAQPIRSFVRFCLFRMRVGQIPVVIAGTGVVAQRVAAIITTNDYIGFRLVGYFSGVRENKENANIVGCPYLGLYKDIVQESKRRDVKILLACQNERLFRAQLSEFSEWFHYVEFLPRIDTFPIFGSRGVNIDCIGGLEMVNQRGMKALNFEKRIVDTILSAIVFLVAFPFFVILPILIKLTSKGPVFYRARRLGKNGRTIWVWKFRSMYADADKRLSELLEAAPKMKAEFEKDFKLKNDPRVTPLGKIMRKLSLDELPQLFNVFAGDMALVGPRPIVEAEVKYYGKDYEVISHVKPGITGLWQASGRSDTGYDRRVSLDLYYVLNWSPWLDIWIVVRTAWKVLSMRGAY